MNGGIPAPLRRYEALAFIVDRIVRSGISPSADEIGRHMGVSSTRAKEFITQLEKERLVERTPGAQRSLRVRDVARSRSLFEECLRRIGWTGAEPLGQLGDPVPEGQLSRLPAFEHLPDID